MQCSCGGFLKKVITKQNIVELRVECKKKGIKQSKHDDVSILLYRLGRGDADKVWPIRKCGSCGRVEVK